LREYAVVADGERGAVIGPQGDVAWMCMPTWDSPSVFSSLIGGTGVYAISPLARYVWGGYYEQGTLIWRSRWVTSNGELECREALAFPGDAHRAVLLRRLMLVDGGVSARLVLNPRAAYDKEPVKKLHRQDDGTWTMTSGPVFMRLSGGGQAQAGPDGHCGRRLRMDLTLAPGRHHDFVLELADGPFEERPPDPDEEWEATKAHWSEVVPELAGFAARRDARHAYAVLAGLTSSSGGMVAAATSSLPERAEAGRTYDYRYAWVRDQCFAGQAVAAVGPHRLLDDAIGFVVERLLADGPHLRPAYTATGGPVPRERSLGLPGYPGGTDVVGNKVTSQFQLDVLGEALLLLAAAANHDRLDVDGWRAVEVAVDTITQRWREPDAGVWELERKRWSHSALECVAGLRAVASARGAPPAAAGRWMALSETVLADVSGTGVHPCGRWKRAVDDDRVDAALLLPAIRGAVPVDDPRSRATHEAVKQDLSRDGYLYRFRQDARPLHEAEGAFLLCGFWMSLASLIRGEEAEAASWLERNRAACGSPGLFSEEFDVVQRQLRGNLPQAFVHAGLLECAARYTKA
jgi:GH15 family glucan-1,4-alpha-glucosidase